MDTNRETNTWKIIFEENTHVLNSIIARQGNTYGSVTVDFRSQFQKKIDALEARRLLRDSFEPSKTTHLYTMNTETGYEIVLSTSIPVKAENITDIEVAMIEVCIPLGGEDITWGFEDDKRTQH